MADILTYKNLQDEVLANLDESGDSGTTLTLVKNFIKQAHATRLASFHWPFMKWHTAQTITMVANQRVYALHPEVARIIYLYNRTQKYHMKELQERSIENMGIDWINTTGDIYWKFADIWPVAAQPSSSSVITVSSSSASDTAVTVIIKGDTASGVTTETITPTGTTPVAGSTAFTKILGVTKTGTWVGTMTLTSNSATVTNLTLLPAEYGRQYRTIEFLSLPNAGEIIEYQFYRQPSVLSNDNDIPDIPAPFSRILVWDALLMFAGYNTDVSQKSMQIWAKMASDLETGLYQTFIQNQTRGAIGSTAILTRDEDFYGGLF